MEVFEHEEHRLASRQVVDQLRHALENQPGVGRSTARNVTDLRQEPSQLRTQRATQPHEQVAVVRDAPGPHGVHPWAERQDLFGLVRAPKQHYHSPAGGIRSELGGQTALANAGFTDHGGDATGPGERDFELGTQALHLRGAPDQARPGTGRRVRDGARAAHRRRRLNRDVLRALVEDLLVERLGLGLRLDAQLPPKHTHAHLVLP